MRSIITFTLAFLAALVNHGCEAFFRGSIAASGGTGGTGSGPGGRRTDFDKVFDLLNAEFGYSCEYGEWLGNTLVECGRRRYSADLYGTGLKNPKLLELAIQVGDQRFRLEYGDIDGDKIGATIDFMEDVKTYL